MKKLVFITLVIFAASCSSKVDNPETKEEIDNAISGHKKEIVELKKKIDVLEEKLSGFDNETQTGIPVTVSKMNYRPFNHYIEVNGSVEAVNAAFISPEINGQVKEIYIKEGQKVNKGDLLVKINSSITENSIKEVETALELANTVFEKQKQLWDKNIGSELDYLSAKNNKESLESRLETLKAQADMALIKAPIDGIIDEIMIKEGELAIPGMLAIQLVNLEQLYVNADVSEAYLTKVKKGDIVKLEFPSYPDISMEVPVHRTGNIVKSANRTFVVQLKIKNKNGMIKPNVLAKVRINDFGVDEALLIPALIVKQDLHGPYVYVVRTENNTAKKVYIETGKSYQGQTMVTKGISEDDLVIIKGFNQVSDGTSVRGL